MAYSDPGVTTIPISSFFLSLSLLFLIIVNCGQWFSHPILMTASASYHKRHLVNAIYLFIFKSRKSHKQWFKVIYLISMCGEWEWRWGCGLIGCLSLPVWLCRRWSASVRVCVCFSLSLSGRTLARPCLACRKDIAKCSVSCSSLLHTHSINVH